MTKIVATFNIEQCKLLWVSSWKKCIINWSPFFKILVTYNRFKNEQENLLYMKQNRYFSNELLLCKKLTTSLSTRYVITSRKSFQMSYFLYEILSEEASKWPEVKVKSSKKYLFYQENIAKSLTCGISDTLWNKNHTEPHLKALKSCWNISGGQVW